MNRLNTPQNCVEQPAKTFGISPPLSLQHPSPEALQKTEELLTCLKINNAFDTTEGTNHRLQVLTKLNALFKKWIRDTSLAKNMPKHIVENLGGQIYTFGSYRLGVHNEDSDIDVLCLAPCSINSNDFFSSFYELLKRQTVVEACEAIRNTFVPILKMKFDGINIDIVFSRLNLSSIPDDININDDKLLRGMDKKSMLSLNGCRVANALVQLVPSMERFCLTLRAIKLWAKNQGICSNSMGYLGGISWAILVAWICQLYPNAAASTLVQKFFLLITRWKWPSPVLLKKIEDIDLGFPVWDPRVNYADRSHLMPIIVPSYPIQNSAVNVSEATKNIILMEINRALLIVNAIMDGQGSWDKLFKPQCFFSRYWHFIVIKVNSENAREHKQFSGLVESKVRHLLPYLTRLNSIKCVHLNTKCFSNKTNINKDNATTSESSKNKNLNPAQTTTPYNSMWFIGLQFENGTTNVDLTFEANSFIQFVTQQADLPLENSSLKIHYCKRKQLSQYLDDDVLKNVKGINDSSKKGRESSLKRTFEQVAVKADNDTPIAKKLCTSV